MKEQRKKKVLTMFFKYFDEINSIFFRKIVEALMNYIYFAIVKEN